MDILYKAEHLACPYYEQGERPVIEVAKMVIGEKKKLSVANNEIVCMIEGRMRFYFLEIRTYEAVKGEILFLPVGGNYSYEALTECMVVIFRVHKPIQFCENYSIEKLYGNNKFISPEDFDTLPQTVPAGILEINSRVWYFLDGVIDCITDGLKCRCWFDLKVKELFALFRVYYTKEALSCFFNTILSGDTAFSEYVRLNWRLYHSIDKLAESMNLTRKQFTKRFEKIFGELPNRWMIERKAQAVHKEITSTKKSFKQIAMENGFNSDTVFIRFCKKELGKTPTELREDAE